MCRYDDAKNYCKRNSLPLESGWVFFLLGETYFDKATPFAWSEMLPYVFQPFRVMAVCMETGEHVKAIGLGGRQKWEAVV